MSDEAGDRTPWWERTPKGASVALGFVKVDRVGSTLDWREVPEEAVLEKRRRSRLPRQSRSPLCPRSDPGLAATPFA